MQVSKTLRLLLVLISALLSLCDLAKAGVPQPVRIPLKTSLKTELLNNKPVATRAYVDAEGSKFAFLMPSGFQLASEQAEGGLRLQNQHRDGSITLAIITAETSATGELKSEMYRDWLLDQHPGAKIVEESTGSAAGKTGPAFDLEWKTSSGIVQSQHVVFVPSDIGVLQFSATTTPEKIQEVRSKLNGILNTFRISKNGKLDIPPLSDKI